MKLKKGNKRMRFFKITFMIMVLVVMVSCSNEPESEEPAENDQPVEEELTGYVLHIEEKRFLMIETEDESVYKELEGLTMEEMLQGDPDVPLVYANYSKTDELNKGDQIIVDYDGVMTFSIPGQINASKVTQIK